jgi:hypothetical protein
MGELWIDVTDVEPEARVRELLPGVAFEICSAYDGFYNCAAWAIGDKHHFWSPEAWWPPDAPKGASVRHLSETYAMFGFEPCGMDSSVETGYDKLAICELDGEWQHVCKQCPDGRWWSKLGDCEDVKHALNDIEAQPDYGTVVLIMKRRKGAT